MDLLDIPLPELRLRIDEKPAVLFDMCEQVARAREWAMDRRREYAGPGYDQLNLYTEITKRPARHSREGVGEATVRTMKNPTAARLMERLLDIAGAVARLDEYCRSRERQRMPGGFA